MTTTPGQPSKRAELDIAIGTWIDADTTDRVSIPAWVDPTAPRTPPHATTEPGHLTARRNGDVITYRQQIGYVDAQSDTAVHAIHVLVTSDVRIELDDLDARFRHHPAAIHVDGLDLTPAAALDLAHHITAAVRVAASQRAIEEWDDAHRADHGAREQDAAGQTIPRLYDPAGDDCPHSGGTREYVNGVPGPWVCNGCGAPLGEIHEQAAEVSWASVVAETEALERLDPDAVKRAGPDTPNPSAEPLDPLPTPPAYVKAITLATELGITISDVIRLAKRRPGGEWIGWVSDPAKTELTALGAERVRRRWADIRQSTGSDDPDLCTCSVQVEAEGDAHATDCGWFGVGDPGPTPPAADEHAGD